MKPITRAPSGHRCGESHHRAKLSDAKVVRMRYMHEHLGVSRPDCSRLFRVPYSTARDILEYATRRNAQ